MSTPLDTLCEGSITNPTWSSLTPIPGTHLLTLRIGNESQHVRVEAPAINFARFSRQLILNLQKLTLTPLLRADELQ